MQDSFYKWNIFYLFNKTVQSFDQSWWLVKILHRLKLLRFWSQLFRLFKWLNLFQFFSFILFWRWRRICFLWRHSHDVIKLSFYQGYLFRGGKGSELSQLVISKLWLTSVIDLQKDAATLFIAIIRCARTNIDRVLYLCIIFYSMHRIFEKLLVNASSVLRSSQTKRRNIG